MAWSLANFVAPLRAGPTRKNIDSCFRILHRAPESDAAVPCIWDAHTRAKNVLELLNWRGQRGCEAGLAKSPNLDLRHGGLLQLVAPQTRTVF